MGLGSGVWTPHSYPLYWYLDWYSRVCFPSITNSINFKGLPVQGPQYANDPDKAPDATFSGGDKHQGESGGA